MCCYYSLYLHFVGTQRGRPVPTAEAMAGRGQTTLHRAAPSLREGTDGEQSPLPETWVVCHTNIYRLSSVSTDIKNITHRAKDKRQKNPQDTPAGPAPFQYLGLSAAASALSESQGHHSNVGTGPASPVRRQDTAVPALLTMTQFSVLFDSTHTGHANRPYGLETHNQSIYGYMLQGLCKWPMACLPPRTQTGSFKKNLSAGKPCEVRLYFVAWIEKKRSPVPSSTFGLGL